MVKVTRWNYIKLSMIKTCVSNLIYLLKMKCLMEISWTKEQWLVMLTMMVTHFFNGMCVSLQAPFYPKEAESKGASATEYGLVFGIFELTVFIVSPIVGKFLPQMGIKRSFCCGISITGAMCIGFGFLDRIINGRLFIGLSFIIRIIEACGNSAFLAASFTLVAQIFPKTVATCFALVEMAFGVGMIIGPTVGGGLYQIGGYTVPFATLGGALLVQATVARLTLPKIQENCHRGEGGQRFGVLKALSIPAVILAVSSVFSASMAVGALQATLERHLAQFNLSPLHVGFFFMMFGAAYALPNPLWGWLVDRYSSKLIIMIGSFFIAIGFLFIGPVPGLGLLPSYELSVFSVIITGVGLGAQLVAAFSEAQRSAVLKGFPDDVSTYSLISSIWTSSFALGAFVGPTAAGALYDVVGFEWSSLFTLTWNLLVCLITIILLINSTLKKMQRNRLYEHLDDKKSYGAIEREKEGNVVDEVEQFLSDRTTYQGV